MAINPLYNTNNSPNNKTQPSKAVNHQGVKIGRTHNTFDMSYHHFKTQKFGQYEPFFVMECVEGDSIPLKTEQEVRSLPFATPFLSELKLNKDFFMVPYQAIQPNTWELFYKLPVQGDDVPSDVTCCMPYGIFESVLNRLSDLFSNFTSLNNYSDIIYLMLSSELLFSSGSLLYQLGYKVNPVFNSIFYDSSENSFSLIKDGSFDSFFDTLFTSLFGDSTSCGVGLWYNGVHYVYGDSGPSGVRINDLYTFISLLRRYGAYGLIQVYGVNGSIKPSSLQWNYVGINRPSDSRGFNITRLLAYQLCCAQYYVNPQVDFIYNAQLYRDNFYSILKELKPDLTVDFFDYNGIKVPYDYFSFHYFRSAFLEIVDSASNTADIYSLFHYIFGFRESLKFGDYFTDSRTQPLALGDNNISVSSDNSISVIDLNRSLVLQRFRNAVVKMKNTLDDYTQSLFGTSPSPDYHIPKYIVHDESIVKSFEVANTSSDTGNLVTNLSSTDSGKLLEIAVDMRCIIIGISSFSVPRLYSQTKDRFFYHDDRNDMFNPMLQYLGDQPVYQLELSERGVDDTNTYGYQSRYNEYKQRVSIVSGGFVEKLPAWSFVTDSLFGAIHSFTIDTVQSPDNIRAHDYEFNRFFKQMSGLSLANGFHFIVVYNNQCNCNRPLEINPNTL